MQETKVVCCFYSVLALLFITAQGKSYRHMYRRHNWFLHLNLIYCTQIVQFDTFISTVSTYNLRVRCIGQSEL
jgi:hypothetical protein